MGPTMNASQAVTISILRHEGRTCSACREPVDAAVMVRPDRATAEAHFLFCRRCAARIGDVSGRLATQPRKRSRAPKLDMATTQAVLELKSALCLVKELGRVQPRTLSPAQHEAHVRQVRSAFEKLAEVRADLDRMLEEDA